ncbi:hypothetical protein [Nocardia nova]|nr:hypothetical protein [Nocardia nova]
MWLGLAEFSLVTNNGHGQLDLGQWCPAEALSPSAYMSDAW